jgi:hypothetical protein
MARTARDVTEGKACDTVGQAKEATIRAPPAFENQAALLPLSSRIGRGTGRPETPEEAVSVTTLKEFEEALREQGMNMALAVLERLRERDRATRSVSPARRVSGRKMTPELAHQILELHAHTGMTQQEIAFELGVNQGRVNEVIKRGKWLTDDPKSPEAQARDKALERMRRGAGIKPQAADRSAAKRRKTLTGARKSAGRPQPPSTQLAFGDL